jgi:hypothetical protein
LRSRSRAGVAMNLLPCGSDKRRADGERERRAGFPPRIAAYLIRIDLKRGMELFIVMRD